MFEVNFRDNKMFVRHCLKKGSVKRPTFKAKNFKKSTHLTKWDRI